MFAYHSQGRRNLIFERDFTENISWIFGCIICFPGHSVVEGLFLILNSNQDPEAKFPLSQSEEKELLLISDSQLQV